MAGKRIVIPNYMPALDLNGNPQAGAKITFYENETTTLKAIYTQSGLSTAHPNPISANAAGVFPSIFADEDEVFSVAITDADDAPIAGLRNKDDVRPSEVYGADSYAAELAADAAEAALAEILAIEATGGEASAIVARAARAANLTDLASVELANRSLGVFATRAIAVAATISPTLTTIRLTGYTAAGDKGAAIYVRSASEPSHDGKFQSADGAWWELSLNQTITPWMFGLVGEVEGTFAGADEAATIQSFFDFINDYECPDVDWTAWAAVGSQVTLGATATVKSRNVAGRLFLRGRNDIASSLVRIDNLANDASYGDLHVSCFGGFAFSVRNTPVAIELGTVSRASFRSLKGDNAQLWGVWATTDPGVNNSNLFQVGKVAAHQCGSGLSAGVGFSRTGTVFSLTQFGSASSTGQYTRVALSGFGDLPPAALDDYANGASAEGGTAWSTPVFIVLTSGAASGRIYHVTHINRVSGRIEVYPQMPASVLAGDTFRWVFGGGLCMSGSDTNVWEVGVLEAQNCGIGFSANMFYGPNIAMGLFDTCGVAIQVGGKTTNSSFGTTFGTSYFESSDIHLLTSSLNADGDLGRTIAFDTALVKDTVNPIDGAGAFTTNYPSNARVIYDIPADGLLVNGVKVVGPKATGWTAATGTALKGAYAAYAGQNVSAAYVEAEAQATDDAAKTNAQRIKAIEDALRTHGLIN